MCGAYGYTSKTNPSLRFKAENKIEVRERYNIRPSLPGIIVTKKSPNKLSVRKFGIETHWKPGLIINAKSETVAELRTFSKMFRESRCLIPASFFFEWQRSEKGKTPYCIQLKDTDCFSFAGLCNDDGFVILTTKPNSLMKPIHNRMPVILDQRDEEMWLSKDTEEKYLMEMFDSYPSSKMEAYVVSDLVNSPRNQTSEVIKPI